MKTAPPDPLSICGIVAALIPHAQNPSEYFAMRSRDGMSEESAAREARKASKRPCRSCSQNRWPGKEIMTHAEAERVALLGISKGYASPAALRDNMGLTIDQANDALARLVKKNQIRRVRMGVYALPQKKEPQ